ncbi:phage protease [Rubritalea sp.]|uniref:phage protease n=1 Tax=Rubritalea sp. TaxID=2109375 RepID=UPI003EF7C017
MSKELLTPSGLMAALNQEPNDKGELWFIVSKYGDFPNTGLDIKTGRSLPITQRFGKAEAVEMVDNFKGVFNRVSHLFRGLPIYEGHADHPQKMRENPDGAPKAVGRVKELEVREDGLWARAVMNEMGVPLIKGDAAPYSGTSPFWWTLDTGKKEKGRSVQRPISLQSIALTNDPNIEGNFIGMNQFQGLEALEDSGAKEQAENNNQPKQKDTMDPKMIREKLGLPEDASDDAVGGKISSILKEIASLKKEKGDATSKLTAANSKVTSLTDELKGFKEGEVTALLNQALTDGKITEAQKEQWQGMLNSNLESGKAILDGMKGGTAALNTADQIKGKVVKGNDAAGTASLNSRMQEYAKKHSLDLGKEAHYDQAYDAVSTAEAND